MTGRILLIEDDPAMFRVLSTDLNDMGYSLVQELDGECGLSRSINEEFALVIIDGNLPKLNGFDVCRRLREKKQSQPIIMLTARTAEIDKVLGIELGADDYITKPFSLREFTARIKSLLRRVNNLANPNISQDNPIHGSNILDFGIIQINLKLHSVTVRGKKVDLTVTEYKLLSVLAESPNKVFSRDELMSQVWNISAQNFDPTITVTIARLRTKIEEDPGYPQIIQTVRGAGYRFCDPRNL